jgi:hypothetical protein
MAGLDLPRLERLGFFLHVPGAELASTLAAVRQQDFAFAGQTHRLYHADGEDLAEDGVLNFLGRVAPFLRREGVRVDVRYQVVKVPAWNGRPAGLESAKVGDDGWFPPEGPTPWVDELCLSLRPGQEPVQVTEDELEVSETYFLMLGDRRFDVYDFGPDEDWDGWGRATRSTIVLLNELLESHGSSERAWALYGGNDLHIAFATEEMARVINDASKPSERLHDGSAGS